MTPKDKALDLFTKFGSMLASDHNFRAISASKKCAIIVVDEIIAEINNINDPEYVYFFALEGDDKGMDGYERIDFYKEVKTELEKL